MHNEGGAVMKYFLASFVLLLTGAISAAAQDINIDLNDLLGPPSSDYAAAGQPGQWNSIATDTGSPVALIDINGDPTDVTVAFTAPFPPNPGWVDGAASGDDEALLEDGNWVIDVVEQIELTGLQGGSYEVIAYGIVTNNAAARTMFMIGDDWINVGGAWTGQFVEGVTHAIYLVEVADTELIIGYVSGYWGMSGFFSGVQLDYLGVVDVNHHTWSEIKEMYR